MSCFEEADLLVDVAALCRSGRADDDQRLAGVKRAKRLITERMTSGEVLAVAKDGSKSLRNLSRRRLPPNQIFINAEPLQLRMEPLDPASIRMAVGEEGAVLQHDGL